MQNHYAEVVRIAPVVHEAGFWCLVMPSASERKAVVVMGRMHNLVCWRCSGWRSCSYTA
jgi:hypothetical protein